jgi:transposase InsO family protein
MVYARPSLNRTVNVCRLKAARLISDNGSQFISKDFKELLEYLEITHTFILTNHQQSNGKLERFNRTLKTEHVRRSAYLNYQDAWC